MLLGSGVLVPRAKLCSRTRPGRALSESPLCAEQLTRRRYGLGRIAYAVRYSDRQIGRCRRCDRDASGCLQVAWPVLLSMVAIAMFELDHCRSSAKT